MLGATLKAKIAAVHAPIGSRQWGPGFHSHRFGSWLGDTLQLAQAEVH